MFKSILKSMGYVKESEIFLEVKNKDKYMSANKKYYKACISGTCYLFTANNLEVAKHRAERNPED